MTVAPAILKRHVAAVVAGNALEVYDFTIYAAFAVQIGRTFFPGHSGFASLMLSLATFGAGFALRPVGAVVIGRYADKAGRRPAMLFSLILMGTAILGLALTPSYAAIGPVAPVLAVVFRMAQGFAFGGEIGPTTAFLIEAAPPARRGAYGAWQGVSQGMAFVAGGLVGVILARVAGPDGLEAWGWRVALGLGAVVLPFGVWLRRTLPETLGHQEAPSGAPLPRRGLRGHGRIIALGLALIASATVFTYVLNYMTTYAVTTLHMGQGVALATNLVFGLTGVAFGLIGGVLTDRFGRRAMLIAPRIVILAVVWPAFALLVRNHDAATLLGVTAVLTAPLAIGAPALFTSLTEGTRKDVRGALFGTVYATSVAVFGGTTQAIIAALIHWTGDPLAPAWYVMGFAAVGLVASILMKETAHGRLAPARLVPAT